MKLNISHQLSDYDKKRLDNFLSYIGPHVSAYSKHATISFIAFKREGIFSLTKMVVALNVVDNNISAKEYKTDNIMAGFYKLSDLAIDLSSLIEQSLSGQIKTAKFNLAIKKEPNDNLSLYYVPFDGGSAQSGRRIDRFSISGGREENLNKTELDWELKSQKNPYRDINELLTDFLIDYSIGQIPSIDFLAFNSVEIDGATTIKDNKAKIGIRCSKDVDHASVLLGYRELDVDQKVNQRLSINGKNIKWSPKDNYMYGEVEIDVKHGAIMNAFVSYNGVAQHEFWFSDPSVSPNSRRSVFQTVDKELKDLSRLLTGEVKKSRDFENAIAWLAWILGFNSAHIGSFEGYQANADVYMTSPDGSYLIVECTTSLFSIDKLSKLSERAVSVKRQLEKSGLGYLKVLPVMVTSKGNEEIKGGLEHAHKIGVHVITQEDLQRFLTNESLFDNRAQSFFDEAYSKMTNHKNSYKQSNEVTINWPDKI